MAMVPGCGWPHRATRYGCARSSTRRWAPTTARRPSGSPGCGARGHPGSRADHRRCRHPGPDQLRLARPVGDVLVGIGIGAFAALACDTASVLEKHGIEVTVVDPRWVLPVPESIVAMAADHRLVVTLEDGLVDGGVGAELIDVGRCRDRHPGDAAGDSQEFIAAATRGEISPTWDCRPRSCRAPSPRRCRSGSTTPSDSSVERATADDAG